MGFISTEFQWVSRLTLADSSHFQCAEPIDPVTRSADPNSWWHQHWNQARVRADLVHHFVKRNKEFTSQQLEEAVLEKLRSWAFVVLLIGLRFMQAKRWLPILVSFWSVF